jgi:cyclase
MKSIPRIVHALVVVVSLAPAVPHNASGQGVTFSVEQLSDRLYLIRGHPGGNVLVWNHENGALLVDAQSASVADSLERVLRGIGVDTVRIIVNTHYHEDHIGGNAEIGRGAVIVAHRNVRLRAVVDTTIDELGWHREPAAPDDLPSLELHGDATYRLGDATAEFILLDPAHTDGDLAVVFPEENVIHTGDVVEVGAYPFIDWWGGGSLDGTIDAVQALLQVGTASTRYVPGHGSVVDGDYLRRYRAMLAEVRDGVSAAIARGEGLEATMDLGLTAVWDDERGGTRAGRRFVGVVFLGLSAGMH